MKINQKEARALAVECATLKVKLGQAGLFATMQKMEKVVQSVGWEIAEQLDAKYKSPKQNGAGE